MLPSLLLSLLLWGFRRGAVMQYTAQPSPAPQHRAQAPEGRAASRAASHARPTNKRQPTLSDLADQSFFAAIECKLVIMPRPAASTRSTQSASCRLSKASRLLEYGWGRRQETELKKPSGKTQPTKIFSRSPSYPSSCCGFARPLVSLPLGDYSV